MIQILIRDNLKILIDECDSWLLNYKWSYQKTRKGKPYYARATINGKRTLMHKLIMAEENKLVDHVNGNGLDNRRSNLRYCNNSENLLNRNKSKNNTSGYKGIWYRKDRGTYVAELTINKRAVIKKSFKTLKEAIVEYNNAAKKYSNGFARLNKFIK